MLKNMTPSKTTTQGQIDKAVANYRALLEKYAKEFDAGVVQMVLGQPEFAEEQFSVLRRRVELLRNCIVRRTKVNRRRTSQKALDATGRERFTDDGVVNAMPVGEGDEIDVVFFKPEPDEYVRPGYMSDDDLEKALARRGLKSDPRAVIAANEDDPAFADAYPHVAHWKDSGGEWCCAAFDCCDDGRSVFVRRRAGVWADCWWFAGVRK